MKAIIVNASKQVQNNKEMCNFGGCGEISEDRSSAVNNGQGCGGTGLEAAADRLTDGMPVTHLFDVQVGLLSQPEGSFEARRTATVKLKVSRKANRVGGEARLLKQATLALAFVRW